MNCQVSVEMTLRGRMVYATATVDIVDSEGNVVHTIQATARVNRDREDAEHVLLRALKEQVVRALSEYKAARQAEATIGSRIASQIQAEVEKVVSG